jgi:RsiW-degrading membrane proteinase PrsW (M82 family)
MVGHYPWFVTNNYLEYYWTRYSFKDEPLKALLRSATIGFLCTLVSDTISNSIRVIKTVKQTSE